MTDKLDLAKLKAVAEAATPGPWFPYCDYQFDLHWLCNDKDHAAIVSKGEDGRPMDWIASFEVHREPNEEYLYNREEKRFTQGTIEPREKRIVAANIEYIATFDPPTVLQLIERVERLEKALTACVLVTEHREDLTSAPQFVFDCEHCGRKGEHFSTCPFGAARAALEGE